MSQENDKDWINSQIFAWISGQKIRKGGCCVNLKGEAHNLRLIVNEAIRREVPLEVQAKQ